MSTSEHDTPTPAAPKKSGRGGVRAGAGRPVKSIEVPADVDSLEFLQRLMVSKSTPEPLRLKAAIALAGFKHAKPAAAAKVGKKEQRLIDAAEAVKPGSKFAAGRPPLQVVQRQEAAG